MRIARGIISITWHVILLTCSDPARGNKVHTCTARSVAKAAAIGRFGPGASVSFVGKKLWEYESATPVKYYRVYVNGEKREMASMVRTGPDGHTTSAGFSKLYRALPPTINTKETLLNTGMPSLIVETFRIGTSLREHIGAKKIAAGKTLLTRSMQITPEQEIPAAPGTEMGRDAYFKVVNNKTLLLPEVSSTYKQHFVRKP